MVTEQEEPKSMSQQSKREYLERVYWRYQRAGRKHKKKILDEFCAVCGHHRKHATRILNYPLKRERSRPGPEAEYGPEVVPHLKRIWLASEQLCSKRLAPALKLWVPFDAEIPEDIREKLLSISPAQIDRLLRPIRAHYPARRRSGTRPGSLIAQQIPIRTGSDEVSEPGYFEVDTVSHGGASAAPEPTASFQGFEQGALDVARFGNCQNLGVVERLASQCAKRDPPAAVGRRGLQHLEKQRRRDVKAATRGV